MSKSGGAWVVGSLVVLGLLAPAAAQAGRHRSAGPGHGSAHASARYAGRHVGWGRHAWRGGHLQCVPFARDDSGIELKGNASIWWNEAAGRYQRGSQPEPGSVLSFSSQGRMRLGHVAVVSDVINAREIEIDHANWWGPGSRGGVNRGVPVVDVSPDNDWTEVRVALGNGNFGSTYRTHGFIYDRPDSGAMVAATAPARAAAPFARLSAAETAVIGAAGGQNADRITLSDEVAEAPDETDLRTARWAHGLQGGFGARLRHPTHLHGRASHSPAAHATARGGRVVHAARLAGRHRG